MPVSTSQSFYDRVLSLFLYGENSTPSEVADERYLPPAEAILESVDVSVADFMAGPGRFANPAFFELVQRFFRASDTDMQAIIDVVDTQGGGVTRLPNGDIEISKEQLQNALGIDFAGLFINQAHFDDGADDYASRVFFWSSTKFQLGHETTFVIKANGDREIEHMSIEPVVEGGEYYKDDFGWKGGWLAEKLQRSVQPFMDPFLIGNDTGEPGRLVVLDISGSIGPGSGSYTYANYINDTFYSAPVSVAGDRPTFGTVEGHLPGELAMDALAAPARTTALKTCWRRRRVNAGLGRARSNSLGPITFTMRNRGKCPDASSTSHRRRSSGPKSACITSYAVADLIALNAS